MNEGWLSYKSPACQLLSVCMIFRLSAAEQVGIMYNALLHAAVPFASFMCWKFSQNDCGTSLIYFWRMSLIYFWRMLIKKHLSLRGESQVALGRPLPLLWRGPL